MYGQNQRVSGINLRTIEGFAGGWLNRSRGWGLDGADRKGATRCWRTRWLPTLHGVSTSTKFTPAPSTVRGLEQG